MGLFYILCIIAYILVQKCNRFMRWQVNTLKRRNWLHVAAHSLLSCRLRRSRPPSAPPQCLARCLQPRFQNRCVVVAGNAQNKGGESKPAASPIAWQEYGVIDGTFPFVTSQRVDFAVNKSFPILCSFTKTIDSIKKRLWKTPQEEQRPLQSLFRHRLIIFKKKTLQQWSDIYLFI